ncbi:hypothetical protein E8E13_008262 [Curvularia kusanoi]|uniref:DNA mismatch repair protein S5 domain-containing protein n=1 Tax=Curvularia kusanoi TaxID=90978 RepID=A0A9P4W7Y8_CURKU|nr:hypothetical protein E8E13_008262 [Curvularia kusanoi]
MADRADCVPWSRIEPEGRHDAPTCLLDQVLVDQLIVMTAEVTKIGSHQLLTDPSSVVKELIDNALDARAKSIFVDIAANTIDCVQVKDDGHGISSEDRALACRRYCTSKIRDFHDLKQVGGKWLGFRGEALASIADMSSTLIITTRVEGEPVAVKLAYQRNGELISTERDSHPVGTTVKITKLLESAKVRRDLALKGSARCLAKIKHIMQAYALARPAVRFRLHVLKAKNDKGDFIYAPKTNANMEDAALKIIGKECALQCDWTALDWEDLELHAFLPKPTALGSKIANHGAFISVDSRPVSPTRGTIKKIALAVRDRMRNANLTLAHVKDPFFTLNIICPEDSYDPNIEPAKDDVIFADDSTVLAAVNRLLISYYPGSSVRTNSVTESDFDNTSSTQPNNLINMDGPLPQLKPPRPIRSDELIEDPDISDTAAPSVIPRWRSTMYGIDEEDLDFLPSNAQVAVDEEEDYRDIHVSNPWTIARMNAPVKPKKTIGNEQLLSPVKSQRDPLSAPGSPSSVATPRQSTRPLDQAQEMEALFRFHESVGPSQKSILSQSSNRIDSKSAAELNPRPQRPRTADGDLYRTKSSNLPLNFIPRGSETHRLSLLVKTSVSSLVRQAQKLDMTVNGLEWGYDCTDAFDTFASAISERTIMDWVAKIDNMLHDTYERIDGIEVRGALREGVQRFVDRRRARDEASHAYAVTTMATKLPNTNSRSTASQDSDCKSHVPASDIANDKPTCPTQSEEWSGRLAAAPVDVKGVTSPTDYDQDFGFAQFVDLNGNVDGPVSPVRSVKMEEEFADDIGDDMLLDL